MLALSVVNLGFEETRNVFQKNEAYEALLCVLGSLADDVVY